MASRTDRATRSLLEASKALVGITVRSLAAVEHTVTLQQYRVLMLLSEQPNLVTRDLAAELGIHPSSATRLCDRLVAKDLLARSVSTRDRREAPLTLTATGRTLVAHVLEERRAAIGKIVRMLSKEDLATAVAALDAFSVAANSTVGEGATAGSAGWW